LKKLWSFTTIKQIKISRISRNSRIIKKMKMEKAFQG